MANLSNGFTFRTPLRFPSIIYLILIILNTKTQQTQVFGLQKRIFGGVGVTVTTPKLCKGLCIKKWFRIQHLRNQNRSLKIMRINMIH